MKNKKTILSIFIYLTLLAVIIVAFVGVNRFQTSNSYTEVLVVKQNIEEGTQMTNTALEKYVEMIKVNKDTVTTIESYDTKNKVVYNEATITGQYSVSIIPAGTIVTTNMFTAKKVDADFLTDVDTSAFVDRQYIVLNATKEYAPANEFRKGRNLAIANVNAYSIVLEDGTQKDFYGILVNKAVVYNVFKNANNEITNVGLVVEATDAKLLTTLQDKGIIFRYIESENMELSTWTSSDVENSFLNSLDSNYKAFINVGDSTKEQSFDEGLFTNENFGKVPTFTDEGVNFYLNGKHSSISIRKYNLTGGIDSFYGECSLTNGYLTYDASKNITKITLPSEEHSFEQEGYYEITLNIKDDNLENYKYHFIIEGQKYERISVINTMGVELEKYKDTSNADIYSFGQVNTQIVSVKEYYNTCIPLVEQKYQDTLEFSDVLKGIYYQEGVEKGSISNKEFSFLIDTNDKIGTLFGDEIENIYLNSDNVEKAIPLFYRIEKASIGKKSDLSTVLTPDSEEGSEDTINNYLGITSSKYYDSDVIQIYNILKSANKDILNDSDTIVKSVLNFILTGEIDATLQTRNKPLSITIVTFSGEEVHVNLELYK